MHTISSVLRFLIAIFVLISGLFGHPGSATPLKDTSRLRVSNGNRILLERGFVLQAWAPAEDSDVSAPPPDTYGKLGFGPTFYDGNGFNNACLEANPTILWSLAKAPDNENGVTGPPGGGEWLSADQLRYAGRLVSVCFGDEQQYSTLETLLLAEWFADFRGRHPDVLLHTNQYPNQWNQEQIKEYLRVAQPDMLTYDTYPFDLRGDRPDYKLPARLADDINYHRIPAMGGYDGSGEEPIPFGQYLIAFKTSASSDVGKYEITQSQKNLTANLTAAMGGKWLNLFRVVVNEEYFLLHNNDGTPTRHFDEYAEISRELAALSDHLVQLQTIDAKVAPGRHTAKWGLILQNDLPRTVKQFRKDTALRIDKIQAKNLGGENDGLPGDVYLGKFAVLPGAAFPEAREYFAVCNGLISGNGLLPEQQHGSCAETRQEITLKINRSREKTLYYVDPATGQALPAALDSEGNAVFTLGGGKMRLFFWA